MAEGTAFSVVGKLAEYAVGRVWHQIKYLFFYNSNIQNLRDKVKDLENRRNDVKLQVDAAKRNAEIIGKEVLEWLRKVDELEEKANEVLKGVESSEMGCLFNGCSNLKSRYLLSRRATKKTIEAEKLKVEGTFEMLSSRPPPEQVLNITSHDGFETRLSIKKEIKEALKDKDIGIIGIYGMPGVGKTTMANEIVNEVKVEKLFEKAVFAVVSNDPDINKIQDQLGEALGPKIEENTTRVRAGRLRQRLEDNDDKSILVVLDDVWDEIDLETIGIPSPHDRLKIMFTTRIEKTCSKMETQRKFEIKVLDKEEGWKLFKDTAGISDYETDIELVRMAKTVADECGGLPLALGVVGKALKGNKTAYTWRDALKQLQRSSTTNLEGMDNKLYQSIRLSYDYLGSEDRDLLLRCSLFAEDESIPIEYLVSYARGLELFKGTETLDETRDRAKKIMDNLKSCNLLQPGGKEDEVKLHDVIRDFCLQMPTTKDKYLVKHAGLTEWPEHDADESYSAISITFDKLGQLPSGLKYPNVKLLRVICRKRGELIISEDFFKDMKELRVLELVSMYIQIPSSIQLLTGLRTLLLTDCVIHSHLSMIGSLKKLEILSFNQSFFDDYSPIEFTNLCNLRSLNLTVFKLPYPLLPGAFSGMKKLEDLNLGCYSFMRGQYVKTLKNAVSELDGNGFINLKTLFILVFDFEYLIDATNTIPNGSFGKLESLKLRNLPKLREICNGNVFEPPLFCNLMTVVISRCDAITSLFRESVAKCLVNLQSIDIDACPMLEEVVSTDTRENEVIKACKMLEFPKLKKVSLRNLSRFKSFTSQSMLNLNQVNFPNMEKLDVNFLDCIVKLLGKEMPITSLHKLTTMSVQYCYQLQSIAESDSIQLLQNLDKLVVDTCHALKVLFDFEGIKVTNDDAEISVLGRLTSLQLYSLPKLVHITKMVPKGICVFQNLTTLTVRDCKRLRYLFLPSMANSLVALKLLEVLKCTALEVLFDFEGIKVTNDDAEISVLGQLRVLELHSLPELVHITRMVPKGICVFQNLTKLTIRLCERLRYLFLPSMANSLVALEVLEVLGCESIEAIFGIEEEGTSEIQKVEEIKTRIVFPKLDRLLLKNLSSIQMFCSQNYELVFPLLMDLTIENCPMMKKLSPWPAGHQRRNKFVTNKTQHDYLKFLIC